MQAQPVVKIHPIRASQAPGPTCSSCIMQTMCMPEGLSEEDMERVDELVYTRRRIRAGETLYRAGQRFQSIYAIRSGFFKTHIMRDDGREQVTGFHMSGELLGIGGIGTEMHTCTATALEDSEICIIPYRRLEALSSQLSAMQRHFHKIMSQEIVRDHGVMMLLGCMNAEERLATFLLNLSQRYAARGYSAAEFNLRMTRQEIGSYLGLKLETVSRLFSRFQAEHLLQVQQKHLCLTDMDGLRRISRQAA
jgi:CRP/FNR family transcriptional regulator, anaerobic regulatory protein